MKKKILAMAVVLSITSAIPFAVAGCGKKVNKEADVTIATAESSSESTTDKETEKETTEKEQTETSLEGKTEEETTVVEQTKEPETQTATVMETAAPTVAPTQVQTAAPTVAVTVAPTQPQTAAPTAAPTQAPTQKQTQAPTTAAVKPTQPQTAAPTQAPTQPQTTKEKTIWDYPFSDSDLEGIRDQCIKWGEEMGLRHVTGLDIPGYEVLTPENTSWSLPTFVSKEWCGERARKEMEEWVKKMQDGIGPLTYFCIWYEHTEEDAWQFYFLY